MKKVPDDLKESYLMGQNDASASQENPANLDQYPLEVLNRVLQILKGRTSRGGGNQKIETARHKVQS
jgi:hypothetical protein